MRTGNICQHCETWYEKCHAHPIEMHPICKGCFDKLCRACGEVDGTKELWGDKVCDLCFEALGANQCQACSKKPATTTDGTFELCQECLDGYKKMEKEMEEEYAKQPHVCPKCKKNESDPVVGPYCGKCYGEYVDEESARHYDPWPDDEEIFNNGRLCVHCKKKPGIECGEGGPLCTACFYLCMVEPSKEETVDGMREELLKFNRKQLTEASDEQIIKLFEQKYPGFTDQWMKGGNIMDEEFAEYCLKHKPGTVKCDVCKKQPADTHQENMNMCKGCFDDYMKMMEAEHRRWVGEQDKPEKCKLCKTYIGNKAATIHNDEFVCSQCAEELEADHENVESWESKPERSEGNNNDTRE